MLKHILRVGIVCSLLSTIAGAESSTLTQKSIYATRQLGKIATVNGYSLVGDMAWVLTPYRPDVQIVGLITDLFGSESELRIVYFTFMKDGVYFSGWTYMLSTQVDPSKAEPKNPTSVLVRKPGQEKITELILVKGGWTTEAPSIKDLHLEPQ